MGDSDLKNKLLENKEKDIKNLKTELEMFR